MLVRKSLSAILVSFGFIGTAHAADLAVSRFQVVDPSGDIYSGAEVTFEVDVDNNDPVSVTDAELEINVPATMVVQLVNVPGGCIADGFTAPQTLTCSLPTLTRDSGNPDHTLTFIATAETANAFAGTVTVSSPTNTDGNASNDSLTITPTVDSGADLVLSLSSSTSSTPAGGVYTYFGDVANDGPDAVNAARVTFSLPPSADFGYQSSAGSNWSCVQSGTGSQTVTCDYSGPSIAAGGTFPQITITGSADVDSGTLSAQADVTVTQVGIGDPELDNNLDGPVVVTITPGTDLEARVQIASSFITGDTGSLTLTIDNNGPTDISGGSQIVHTLSPDLEIDGPLPTGCVEVTGTITCTAGSMSTGDVEDFVIPIRALTDTGGNQTISATVTPPVGIDDPISGNDTGSDTFRIDDPASDIFLQSKTKTPNPVEAGENMTSTIRVENDGPSVLDWSPANPIVITDDLGPDETFVSVTTSGWNCVTGASPDAAYDTRVTCTTTDTGSIAVDARKTLQIVTQAGASADGNITNNACIDVSGLAVADPNTGNNCRSRTSRATTEEANLSIQAEVSTNGSAGFVDTASPAARLTISDATTSHFYRLIVSNDAGSDTARTVYIRSEDLSPWMNTTVNFNGGSVDHDTAVSVFSASSGVTCSGLGSNDNIRCEATNLAPGTSVTLVLQVDRPILDGMRSTTFAVSSPDTVETNTSDNTDVARVDIEPIADLTVDDKRVSPNPPQSGEDATYLIDIKNIGPNTGDAVASADFIDPTLFEVTNVTTTAPGGSCDYDVTTADTATCSMGSVDRGETFQMSISVRPRFPFAGASNPGDFPVSHTNTATVSTTTAEIDPVGNNSRSLTHDVGSPSLDMRVSNAEPSGFVEPSTYGTTLLYEIVTRNGGQTQGTGVTTTVTPAPPVGYEMAYNAGSSTVPAGVNCSQVSNSDPVICTYPNMSTSDSETAILAFDLVDIGGGAPASTITAGTTAVVTSDQQDYDTPIANNTASQTTTIIPSTDLEVVSKTRVSPASPAPINIAEPVVYDIVFRNNGPSATTQVRVTDTLPAGFERTATAVTFTPTGSTTVSGSTCSTNTTVLCVIDGTFPGNSDLITMRIEVAATFPFTSSTSDPIVNSASIGVGETAGGDPISADENAANNSASTSDGLLQLSSISGAVYSDNDRGDDFDASEGIGSVTMTLTGTDLYGNSVSVVVQTLSDGTYTFAGIPPSDANGYTITQTQPSGHFDYQETAGTASGTVDNGSFGSGAAQNAITQIVLGEGVDATGYLFADYAAATVSGFIYSDDDNDGTRDGGEAGIASGYAATPHLQLTGIDYSGTAVTETVSVNGSGAYSFADLPPSNGTGYVVEQLQEPTGFYDGLEENGSGATLAGTVDGSEQIDVGNVDPGVSLTDRNFGQVAVSTFAGIVYEDDNGNGSREGGETDTFTGATIELSGTDDLGRSISCTVTSGADGSFSFPAAACPEIRPGSYAITMTDAPNRLPTGTTAGSAGGTQGTDDVTSITVTAGTNGTDYLFGVENNDIQANNNDFTSTPINGFEGGSTASVFPDDRINGSAFADADVAATITSDGGLTGVSINSDGTLDVPAGTPAGTYTVGYQICETVNSDNCDPATAIIEINPPVIRANPDDFTGTEINGADGGVTASVFSDDRLNNAPFADSEISATILGDGGLTGVTINSNGTLNVPAGTPEGTYTVSYEICEVLNPTNCHDSTAIILVGAPTIVANDNDFTAVPLNGADGGNTASVFPDDRLNNAVFADGDVIPSIILDGGLTGVTINADGTLSVPAGTPEGTYHVTYQICEALNTDNCDPAIASILIEPPLIVANDNDFTGTPFNGADGGSTTSVFPDDRLNGSTFADAHVTPSILSDGGLTGAVLNADGTIDVPAGTPEGTYAITYQICEVLNPDNCDPAIATIVVDAAPIIANDDDFTGTPFNGADGGSTTSVFPDDRLNGSTFANADVTPSILSDGGLTGAVLNSDGTIDVPAGTPEGTYAITYQICEVLNPDNCDPAIATIVVDAAPIVANDNDFTATPINGADGGSTASVFPDDRLNGSSFADADVVVSLLADGGLTGVAINSDGTLSVPAGTPAGTYQVEYQICEALNPDNCDPAFATIEIEAAPIVANDNDFTSTPVVGSEGGALGNVLPNDTLNDESIDPADITITLVSGDPEVELDLATGEVQVPPGTPAGTYTFEYRICENLNPDNCDTAITTVEVVAIDANDNDFTSTPVIGSEGGTLGSILPNDTLNGGSIDPTDITITLVSGDPELELDLTTGDVQVPPGTPAGTYTFEYQICENLNPTNCDTAVTTVLVTAAVIDANDNDFTPTPVIGSEGGTLGSILPNDTLNGGSIDPADITITLVSGDPELELDLTTGEVQVPPGTPAGTYTFEYQICENLNPTNCDTAITTVEVTAAAIDANDQDYSATPVNGAEGGTLPTVFSNDTLNGDPFDPSDVTATIENDGGLTGVTINPDGTISVPAGSIAGTYTVEYQICEVLNPTNCDTAEIIITVVTDASVAGTVFLDANADDALQSGETLLPGYTVELRANGNVIATTTTDANGAYAFDGLDPDLTYEVVFIESNTGTVIDTIDQVDLVPGEDRTGLNEPVAPSGTVYDVAANEAVVGGVVTVVDMNGQPLPPACFSDPSQQGQLTTADGYYFFGLVPGGAAACPMSGAEYRIEVTLPNGLTGVFGATPQDVSEGALDPGVCANDALSGPVCEVSNSPDRPDAASMPAFYAQFSVGAGDPEFANNHIPVNTSVSQAPLVTTKRTLSANASVGSVIVYTITVSNPFDVPQSNVDIVDQLPAGLVFIAGSGRVNGVEIEPVVEARTLTWSGQTVPARGAVEITLGVAVGAGVTVGEYVNTAYADNGPQDVRISNIAEATVRITPDEIFDCSEVLGKVFEDKNRNGIQDDGEEGLPGVRVATVKGLLITTDEYGRYHIACAATPKPGIGSNFIVKLDERTLPTGFEVMTENPRVVRLTQGKMSQVDFGVGALRPVEFQLRPEAFVSETLEMTDRTKSDVEQLIEILGQEPSILTLVYFGETLSDDRLALIKQALEDRWSDQGEPYKLVIETEVVNSSQNP